MVLKESVTRQGVQPPIWFAIGVVEACLRNTRWPCVVTSLTDSHAHRPASLHNRGLAADIRTRHIPADYLPSFVDSVKSILDPLGFDVVLESDHLHMEYDPKGVETWFTLELRPQPIA